MRKNKAKISVIENVNIQVFDKKGKRKNLFKHNFLGQFFMNRGLDLKGFFFGGYAKELNLSNLVVNGAFAEVTGAILGTGMTKYEYIGIGTGTTAVAGTNTTLGTEINNDGNPSFTNRGGTATAMQETTTVTDDTVQVIKIFTMGAYDPAITESGLFNSNTAGNMFARKVFSSISPGASGSIQITWKIVVSTP